MQPANELQAAILEQFRFYFAKDTAVLYIAGSTVDTDKLAQLHITPAVYSQLPSMVLYNAKQNWLYLIANTINDSHISPTRLSVWDELFRDCPAGLIFVTAVPDMATYRHCADDIAVGTMVWVADRPNHSIHYDSEGVLLPR